MSSDRKKRKLTAILSADVKGYSRLMGEDEIATVDTLKEYRQVLASHIHQYNGRVVDSPGDNLLAAFSSVVDAVECAVTIQEDIGARNAALSERRKMAFRIGINLGDIIEDGDRIYGDGVNIAARIESLAEGGGLCISGTAYDQVKNKLDLHFQAAVERDRTAGACYAATAGASELVGPGCIADYGAGRIFFFNRARQISPLLKKWCFPYRINLLLLCCPSST